MIKQRNLVSIYVFTFLTLGIYGIYWNVKTKDELNSLGGEIPSGWLLIVPIANLYWLYRYSEAFSKFIKKDNNSVLWFLLFALISIIMPAIVQSELNKLAIKSA